VDVSQPPTDPRDVLVSWLTPHDLEERAIIFEVVGKVSTSDRRRPEAALRRKAAELGANVVLAYERGYLPGLSRGLAAQVLDVSALVSSHRRLGVWALLAGAALAGLGLIATAYDHWGLAYDVRSVIADAAVGLGMCLAGFGVWLMVKGRP
jgi:hypothetical protein